VDGDLTSPEFTSQLDDKHSRCRQVTKVTTSTGLNITFRAVLAKFHGQTAHWLPVVTAKTPIIYCGNGFPRPVVLEELRNQHRYDRGV
jgi:hypothetical protein